MKRSKIRYPLYALGAAVAAALLFVIVINGFVCLRASRDFSDDAEKTPADYILVPGCGLNPDRTPGKLLSERMNEAIAIYKKQGGKLLLSGDHTSPYYDEPGAMRRMALENGVLPEDIVIDKYGTSTAESVFRAKSEFGAGSVIIVTQRYHLYRAVYIAQAIGLEVKGAVAGESGSVGLGQLLRETLARVKDCFYVLKYR